MSGLYSRFIAPYVNVILAVLLVISATIAVVQTVRIGGFHLGPIKVTGFAEAANLNKDAAEASNAAAGQSEENRAEEQEGARQSYADQLERCEARMETLRAGTQIIQEIADGTAQETMDSAVQGDQPRTDTPAHSSILRADRLRVIAGQSAGGSPSGLPAGNDGGGSPRAGDARHGGGSAP